MKIRKSNPIASIIIVNYNNAKYLNKSVNSALNQNYKSKEIIVIDDNSSDNSIKILQTYKKKIFIIKKKKKFKYGSYNQIQSYFKGFLKSKGRYIFFLDSDDYFKKNKIKNVIDHFEKNKKINVIFDLPILKYKKRNEKKKFKQKNFLLSSWPRFSNQSCISAKRNFARKLFKISKINRFNTIWFDFRIASYCYLKEKKIDILEKYLTYYRQLDNSASKKYKTFSKDWWKRRNEAHDFMTYLNKKLKIKDRLTIDKIITKIFFKIK